MRGALLPGFWPKNRMQSDLPKSSRVTVPTACPMLAGSATEVGLVAHVGRVGQVVVAIKPGEELVQVARFVRQAARTIEHRALVTVLDCAQLLGDLLQGMPPGDGHVLIAGGGVAERVCQAARLFEVEIVPAPKFGDGVLGEELRRAAMCGQLPGDRLDAILAELERQGARGLHSGAAVALVAVDLVVAGQRDRHARQHPFAPQDVADGAGRPPSP